MTKKDFVRKMAEEMGTSQSIARRAINAFQTVVIDALDKNKEVRMVGFGRWYMQERKGRTYKDFKTGEIVKDTKHTFPRFVFYRGTCVKLRKNI